MNVYKVPLPLSTHGSAPILFPAGILHNLSGCWDIMVRSTPSKGNRFWMEARESILKSDKLGDLSRIISDH